jgi:hypothetical protein
MVMIKKDHCSISGCYCRQEIIYADAQTAEQQPNRINILSIMYKYSKQQTQPEESDNFIWQQTGTDVDLERI